MCAFFFGGSGGVGEGFSVGREPSDGSTTVEAVFACRCITLAWRSSRARCNVDHASADLGKRWSVWIPGGRREGLGETSMLVMSRCQAPNMYYVLYAACTDEGGGGMHKSSLPGFTLFSGTASCALWKLRIYLGPRPSDWPKTPQHPISTKRPRVLRIFHPSPITVGTPPKTRISIRDPRHFQFLVGVATVVFRPEDELAP